MASTANRPERKSKNNECRFFFQSSWLGPRGMERWQNNEKERFIITSESELVPDKDGGNTLIVEGANFSKLIRDKRAELCKGTREVCTRTSFYTHAQKF